MRKLKSYIPNIIFRIWYYYQKNKYLRNIYCSSYSKRALLSYIIRPFEKKSMAHTNYFEAQSIASALNSMGYVVDVVHYETNRKIDFSKYDVLIGFGDLFQERFEKYEGIIKTIYYGAGMHVNIQNNNTLKRVKEVYKKKSKWLCASSRYVEKAWTHQTMLVDGIIALGNERCLQTYRDYYTGLGYSILSPYYKILNPNEIIKLKMNDSKRSYLWFGSTGLIHKGLDLLLDYFKKHNEVSLYVCGPINKENDFFKAYEDELTNYKNIKNYGFVDLSSEKFIEIMKECMFVVLPSCSEGGAPSVVTCIGNGGLIPIISRESSVETGEQIWIESLDEVGINTAINASLLLSNDDLLQMQLKNIAFVEKNHSQKKYFEKLQASIAEILEVVVEV